LTGWVALLFGARRTQLLAVHQAAHARLTGHAAFDRRFGRIASVLLFLEEFTAYAKQHGPVHHSKRLSTLVDPTVRFLSRAGFEPGRSVAWSYRHLALTLLSPRFHIRVFADRVGSHLRASSRWS